MPGRILIVEDDRAIAQSLARLLSRYDYYVAIKGSAEEAATHIKADRDYDLALLDVTLPAQDGFSCCRELRKAGWRRPVIMLTGRSASSDKVLGLEAGADDYITKPFDPMELLARIKAHLRRFHDYSAPNVMIDHIDVGPSLVVDLRNRDAIVRGEAARLTDREYELLLLLARNMGTALDKSWLFQEIWGCAPEMGLKVLSVYVCRLRKKIEEDENHPRYLRTVHGFGYKLTPAESA